jgi:Ca2+-binding EF-hand superfamily protein
MNNLFAAQDRDGLITSNDVYRLMIRLGEVVWDTEVAAMFNEADIDSDGKISRKGKC